MAGYFDDDVDFWTCVCGNDNIDCDTCTACGLIKSEAKEKWIAQQGETGGTNGRTSGLNGGSPRPKSASQSATGLTSADTVKAPKSKGRGAAALFAILVVVLLAGAGFLVARNIQGTAPSSSGGAAPRSSSAGKTDDGSVAPGPVGTWVANNTPSEKLTLTVDSNLSFEITSSLYDGVIRGTLRTDSGYSGWRGMVLKNKYIEEGQYAFRVYGVKEGLDMTFFFVYEEAGSSLRECCMLRSSDGSGVIFYRK